MQIDGQEIPVYEDLADLSLEQLLAEKKRLGPIYVKRFEFEYGGIHGDHDLCGYQYDDREHRVQRKSLA